MSYGAEWIPVLVVLGTLLLFPIVPGLVVALAAAVALVALAGAMLATPYVLVRSLRRRLAERRPSTEGSRPIAGVIARSGTATKQPGVGAVGRRSRRGRARPAVTARPRVSEAGPHNATQSVRFSSIPTRTAQAGLASRRLGHSRSNGAVTPLGTRPTAGPALGTDHRAQELLGRRQLSATELGVLLELLGRRDASFHELGQALVARPADLLPPARSLAMRGLIESHHDGTSERVLLAVTAAGLATVHGLLAGAADPAAREPAVALGAPGWAV